MKKTGQLLKEKRESAKLSISEVALATKINPKILAAIENGDETNLPAKPFLKGFLRSYALFLKMNVEEVLRSYQDELGGPVKERVHEVNMPQAATPPGTRRSMAEENSSGLRTAAVVVIVILIGVIIGVRELIEKYQREKLVENSPAVKVSPLAQPALVPLAKAPEPEALPAPAAMPLPVPAPLPSPGPLAKPVQNVEVTASEPVVAAKPVVETKPVEVAKPEPKPPEPVTPVAKAPEVKSESAAPSAAASPEATAVSKPVKNEIILEALDKVDVKFQIKGQTKMVSLGPTQVHTIHSDQPVVFDFSDGGAVNIIFNGRERGPPGDLGKPKQIKIP